VYRVLVGKPEGKTLRRRPRDKWENGIRMNLVEIGWGCGVNSVESALEPVADFCDCSDEPSSSGAAELVF
jgi:hypothetical protein